MHQNIGNRIDTLENISDIMADIVYMSVSVLIIGLIMIIVSKRKILYALIFKREFEDIKDFFNKLKPVKKPLICLIGGFILILCSWLIVYTLSKLVNFNNLTLNNSWWAV